MQCTIDATDTAINSLTQTVETEVIDGQDVHLTRINQIEKHIDTQKRLASALGIDLPHHPVERNLTLQKKVVAYKANKIDALKFNAFIDELETQIQENKRVLDTCPASMKGQMEDAAAARIPSLVNTDWPLPSQKCIKSS